MTIKGINQNRTQEYNRTLIMNEIRKYGVCSRVQLSNLTGLKGATVTYIINDLLNFKLVKEVGHMSGGVGRHSVGISIDNSLYRVIGIKLTRNSFTIGLFNLSNEVINRYHVKTENQNPEDIIIQIKDMIGNIIKREPSILAIGIALPGPFIRSKSKIALMTGVAGWDKYNIKKELEETFGIPVYSEHDSNAGAYSYYLDSISGNEENTIAYLLISGGVGAGIIMNGRLISGKDGTAGEIGHTSICFNGIKCECGNRGCLEKYTSSYAFVLNLSKKLGRKITLEEATELVRTGDKEAIEAYSDIGRHLGYGMVNLIYSYNPNRIIIDDYMAHIAPEILLDNAIKVVNERVMSSIRENLIIEVYEKQNDAVLSGSSNIVINEVISNISNFIKGGGV